MITTNLFDISDKLYRVKKMARFELAFFL